MMRLNRVKGATLLTQASRKEKSAAGLTYVFTTSGSWYSSIARAGPRSTTWVAGRVRHSSLLAHGRGSSLYVEEWVQEYAQKDATPLSLQRLLQTGKGEALLWTVPPENMDDPQDLGQGTGLTEEVGSPFNPTLRPITPAVRPKTDPRILIHVANFLSQELPIRLAHRIQDLETLVPGWRDMPTVQHVKQLYTESFLQLLDTPAITNEAEERQFATLLAELYQKHSSVLVQMAQGAFELREALRSGHISSASSHHPFNQAEEFELWQECHGFLDRFYMSRIGIRFLVGQYLALRGNDPIQNPDYVGMICQHTSPAQVVRKAAQDASLMCRRAYGRAPRVQMQGRLDLTLPYMPTYLHYVLLELLKNSCRATAERYTTSTGGSLPPVTVIIADGTENEDVVIKIEDQGGGIARSQMSKIWSYLYTTADPAIQRSFILDQPPISRSNVAADHAIESPIAGLGYGLPISRAYLRYFGGDLDLVSMEGYGTDAFVYLQRLGDCREPV